MARGRSWMGGWGRGGRLGDQGGGEMGVGGGEEGGAVDDKIGRLVPIRRRQ